jgi:hypothetical protein
MNMQIVQYEPKRIYLCHLQRNYYVLPIFYCSTPNLDLDVVLG